MDLQFKFEIVDTDEDEVLWTDSTYILVDPTTGDLSSDAIETHVYSALRGLKRELAQKAQQKLDDAEEARREQEELDADEAAGFIDPVRPRFESVTSIRDRINKIIMETDDWYERRHELECGDVFRLHDGDIVKLDHPKPGDGTRWVVQSWYNDHWSNDEATIEPGDLKEKIKDPKAK